MNEQASRDRKQRLEAELRDPANRKIVDAAKRTIDSRPPPGKRALENLASEVEGASSTLIESVDQIVEVLTLVLGNISKIAKTQEITATRSRHALLWIRASTIVSLFVLLATAYLLVRLDAAASDLKATESRVNQAIEALHQTDQKVEEVKQSAEETSRVEIVADDDESGSAVVRITPPKAPKGSGGTGDAEPLAPPARAVEIPLDLYGAKESR